MSRFEESKLLEYDKRLDHLSSELNSLRKEKEEPEKEMTMIRVVAVEFDQNKYKFGEAEVNRNITDGFVIQKEFQTDSGVVIFMTKWKKPKKVEYKCP